ncbi:MAG: prolyl oligopeptidase family serine peptidase [Pseudomonadales bacterium]|nr:prolyl oligopeptidase family serine peptidase [Pseudomonadales bacterium]
MADYLHEGELTLDNGIRGEMWTVSTANPETFYQAISQPESVPVTEIYAQNFYPSDDLLRDGEKPPIVVVVPGSMGIAPSHVHKAKLFTDAGFATCLLDPFGAREVSSTVANQAQFSFAASAWDVLATVEALSRNDRVDPARIGTQGHSRGGSAILSAASMLKFSNFEGRMAGAYAAYPWSGQQFLNPDVGDTKVRSVVGDQDEWCSPQQVQGHMQALRLSGCETSWRIFAGAHHSFDRATPVEMIAEASVAPGAPTIYIEDDGTCIHPVTGPCAIETQERELMLYGIKAGYGNRGARLGTSSDFADQFHVDMMEFWRACFA